MNDITDLAALAAYWKEQVDAWKCAGTSQIRPMNCPITGLFIGAASLNMARMVARRVAAIVERELGHNPFDGGLYAFTNRRRNKIKCLYWEDNGFVLYYKALAEEKFRWPRRGEEIVLLTGQQINWLLDGFDITLMTGHKKLHYESVF